MLDFKSVQRSNPEMQRRCQGVINTCAHLEYNIISSIHDVGAGGLSNAIPEIVHDSKLGALIQLRDIPCDDTSLSPMEIWCNESQERYVLAIEPDPEMLKGFEKICSRERCPFAVVGVATVERMLIVFDSLSDTYSVTMPMSVLFAKFDNTFNDSSTSQQLSQFVPSKQSISDIAYRILRLPSVGSKSFLITIGDRSVTGLVTRDQMIGKWQVPVSDVSVVSLDYTGFKGQAMCMGEKPILALINPASSARMAVCESLTNLVATDVPDLSTVCMSANWMASLDDSGQACALYEAVNAVGLELCPELGICIPVGKDSLSMKTSWDEQGLRRSVSSPMSLVITAYGSVEDVRNTLTPEIGRSQIDTILMFVDLAGGKMRLGGSAFCQVYNQIGDDCPDLECVQVFKGFWAFMNKMRSKILAYHDRSDGGMLTVLCEMAFAGRVGLDIAIDTLDYESYLFNEELGAIIEIEASDLKLFLDLEFGSNIIKLGAVNKQSRKILIKNKTNIILDESIITLQQAWCDTSFEIQKLRGSSECAILEYSTISDNSNLGLSESFGYSLTAKLYEKKPRVAILREQGINGHVELAFAFHQAGFEVVDVHMSDLKDGSVKLDSFSGLACPGGFSFGDVLGIKS